jgi:acylglycerol lipase
MSIADSFIQTPRLDANLASMPDGAELYFRTWGNAEDPLLVLLGVHGFNDYGQAFAGLEALVEQQPGIRIYAYDQRGHGLSGELGRWPGADRLQADLRVMVRLLKQRFPNAHLVVLGESMGGAVVLTTLNSEEGLDADAVVLLAPAVWGVEAMPWYQRFGLWLARKLVPGASFSAAVARDLGIRPTDDHDVAQALAADPLVQKTARADTLHGLAELMTQAAGRSVPDAYEVLVLYGLRDTVIPPGAVCSWLQLPQMDSARRLRLAIYPQGYHLLTRQTRSQAVLADLQHWLEELLEGRELWKDNGPFRLADTALPVPGLQYEQSLAQAREAVCSLPAVGLRERP